jgi:hypothetical protein
MGRKRALLERCQGLVREVAGAETELGEGGGVVVVVVVEVEVVG